MDNLSFSNGQSVIFWVIPGPGRGAGARVALGSSGPTKAVCINSLDESAMSSSAVFVDPKSI